MSAEICRHIRTYLKRTHKPTYAHPRSYNRTIIFLCACTSNCTSYAPLAIQWLQLHQTYTHTHTHPHTHTHKQTQLQYTHTHTHIHTLTRIHTHPHTSAHTSANTHPLCFPLLLFHFVHHCVLGIHLCIVTHSPYHTLLFSASLCCSNQRIISGDFCPGITSSHHFPLHI